MSVSGSGGPLSRRILARLGADVRPGEARITALLSLGMFLMIAFQYMAKAVRQATYVDALGATKLPYVYLLVAICSYPVLRLYVTYADRVSRHRLIAASGAVVAAVTAGFWWAYQFSWRWVPVAFYIWAAIVFVALLSQFWSFANHVLDARQARRLFGLIGAGGMLGGIAGGQAARIATQLIGTRHTLLLATAILVACAAVLRGVPRAHAIADKPEEPEAGPEDVRSSPGGFELMRSSAHLRLIAVVMVLSVAVAQIVDLQFNWAVERATTTLAERTAWFGGFFSVISLAAFVFQILFTSLFHTALGVGVAMRVLPLAIGLGTAALLVSSGFFPEMVLAAVMALKVGEGGVRHSVDQSTRELLFLPVPAAVRVRAKAFIDLLVQRGAEGLAAVVLLPVTFGLITPVQAGWMTLVLVSLWLAAAGAAFRTYVRAFRQGLKDRTLDSVIPINLSDVKTVELLVQSLGSADSRQVLHSLDILESNGRGNLVPPLLLYHDDPEVRRRTLGILAFADRKDAAPLVERRLGDDSPDVRAEAIRVLTQFHAGDVCALMLPRLKEADPKVKAAAVTCLINLGNEHEAEEARRVLLDMLSEEDAERRAEAIKALGAIRGAEFEGRLLRALDDPDPMVAREAIHAVRRVVEREGFAPMLLPRLVSLLQNRRLKLDAREALVGFGQEAIPILTHFMNDREESITVRRALPKTLARIPGPAAVSALVASLPEAEDAFLRTQLVEALALRRDEARLCDTAGRIEQAVETEARRYLRRLADLAALSGERSPRIDGLLPQWDRRTLNLLAQMLAERMEVHLRTMFGLLALLLPPQDVWASYRGLVSSRRQVRAHALEYLDNTLAGTLRRNVFAVINDVPVEEKLRAAARGFGVGVVSRTESAGRLIDEGRSGDADSRALSVAALYTVHTDRMTDLGPMVNALLAETHDPLVSETAAWVAERLGGAPSLRGAD